MGINSYKLASDKRKKKTQTFVGMIVSKLHSFLVVERPINSEMMVPTGKADIQAWAVRRPGTVAECISMDSGVPGLSESDFLTR